MQHLAKQRCNILYFENVHEGPSGEEQYGKSVLFIFPKPGKIDYIILPNLLFLKERNRIREACIGNASLILCFMYIQSMYRQYRQTFSFQNSIKMIKLSK